MDSKCHKLTASFVRERRSQDSSIPLCLFYEVTLGVSMCVCVGGCVGVGVGVGVGVRACVCVC